MSAYHAWQRVVHAAREFIRAADLPDKVDNVYPKVHAIEEFKVAITSWVHASEEERAALQNPSAEGAEIIPLRSHQP